MMAAEVDGAEGRDPGLDDLEAGVAAVLLQRVEDGREPVAVCKRNSPKTVRKFKAAELAFSRIEPMLYISSPNKLVDYLYVLGHIARPS